MTELLERMRTELVRRNYAATTIRTYLHALNLLGSSIGRV